MGSGSDAVGVRGRRGMIALATVPTIVSYTIFMVLPMAYALVMSFTNWNPASRCV